MTAHTCPATDLDRPAVIRCIVEVDGIPMSGLLAEANEPRAVIIAIHGGATHSPYFDYPGHPENSLLRTGAAAGYTVLSLDRPGYGTSAPHHERMSEPHQRVDLAFTAIDEIFADRPTGAGYFLWAHSIGCELAVRLAADPRAAGFLGIELSGTGLQHQPQAHEILGDNERNAPAEGVRKLLWEPAALYPPDVIGGQAIASRSAPFEGATVRRWPTEDFRALAPRVEMPVHFTAGRYEHVWRTDLEALAEIAGLFSAAPLVQVAEQFAGGHNLSIGHTARAYHLSVLAFVELCAALHTHPDLPAHAHGAGPHTRRE